MFDYKKFGENYKNYRESLNLSRVKVCDLLDINYSYLAEVETGKRKPSTKLIIGMANVINKSISQIMEYDNPKEAIIDEIVFLISKFPKEEQERLYTALQQINNKTEQ